MTMQSGQVNYQYAYGTGPFIANNHYGPNPIGLSGILIEQAQFVILTELRKRVALADIFNKYITQDETGINNITVTPYEPSTTDLNLCNPNDPANASFLDHILETRLYLESLFIFFSMDSSYTSQDFKKSWLNNLYKNSPSGFNGDWLRQSPQSTGVVDHTSLEFLGGSGILFDVDVGEIMFNPFPYLAADGVVSINNPEGNPSIDGVEVGAYPAFPQFQKTNGNIITPNGREPLFNLGYPDYNIDHIQSGYISIAGGYLLPTTSFYISRNGNLVDTTSTDFTYQVQGRRGGVPDSRVFVQPQAQPCGVYRLSAVNHYSNNPLTTIESGIVSIWPPLSIYYSSSAGYQVFDDCIWITDSYSDISLSSPASGLVILSPFTGHEMWMQQAEQTNVEVSSQKKYWGNLRGLERITQDKIYRLHPVLEPQGGGGPSSYRRLTVLEYNDDLDFVNSFTSTSATPAPNENFFPTLSSDVEEVYDFWYDGTYFWVTPATFAGYDFYKFDSAWDFQGKYVLNGTAIPATGVYDIKGFSHNGNSYIYKISNESFGQIIPITETLTDADPFVSNTAQAGGIITAGTGKPIDNSNFPSYTSANIIVDMLSVSSSTHVVPGIYALVVKTVTFNNRRDLFLFRLEEETSNWTVKASKLLKSNVDIDNDSNILYMPY